MPRLSIYSGDSSGRSPWVKVIGALLLLIIVAVGFLPFAFRQYIEVDLYAVAGSRMRAGEEIYRLNERPFTYPPLLAVPGVVLSYLPVLAYRFVWYISIWATLGLSVGLVMRRVRESASPGANHSLRLYWGLVLVLTARHLTPPIENQSHDLLICLCVLLAIDAWSRFASLKAAVWAGAATALKATPLLFLALFVWQRRWRAVTVMVLACVGLTLATDVLWPRRDGRFWAVVWYQTFLNQASPGELTTVAAWDPWCPLNQSLAGTLQRLLKPLPPSRGADEIDVSILDVSPTVLRAITRLGLASIFGWMLYVTRPRLTEGLTDRQQQFLRLAQGGVVVIAMVLLSPTSIKTHFAVMLLPIAVCVADYLWHGRDRITGGLLLVVFLAGTLTAKGVIGDDIGNFLMASGSVTLVALALLVAAGRIVILRSRQWQVGVRENPAEWGQFPVRAA